MKMQRLLISLTSAALLSGCATSWKNSTAPAPKFEQRAQNGELPRSKYGNPPLYEVFGKRYYVMQTSLGYEQRGTASWYGKKFHGRRTANGEVYDMYGMTAAHKQLPFDTLVEVKNLEGYTYIFSEDEDLSPKYDPYFIY